MIYIELYNGLKTKNELANKLDVNAKTIENTIGQYSEDIIMVRAEILLPVKYCVLFKLLERKSGQCFINKTCNKSLL
jgi:hypothetical protein